MKKKPNATAGFPGLDRVFTAIQATATINALQELVQTVVVTMLRRNEDTSLRERTLATISAYFSHMRGIEGMEPRDKLAQLRVFTRETVQIVFNERPLTAETARGLAPVLQAAQPQRRRAADHAAPAAAAVAAPVAASAPKPPAGPVVVDLTDTSLSTTDLENPTAIVLPQPPAPAKFDTFRELFPAALHYRLGSLLRFFQRSNTEAGRELVRPFLLTPEFETRFMQVVTTIIVPKMFLLSRNLLALETSRKWDEVSTEQFWGIIYANDRTRIAVVGAWEEAWNTCRQHSAQRKGPDGEIRRVLVASPELKTIRDILTPEAGVYDIPAIRNPEIDLFISLLTDFDLVRLEYCFTKLRQMYEQELDRRWYQDRARVGALRDSLLEAIDVFPDRTGDFLALLCYYCFPNTDITFLDRFTHNKGPNHAARVERLPYLMRFLAQEQVPVIRRREDRDRVDREALAREERERMRAAEREASARVHG